MHAQTNTARTVQASDALAAQVEAIVNVASAMEGAARELAGSTESTSPRIREY